MTLGTLVVLILLAIVMTAAICSMVKNKRAGKSLSCSGDCSKCSGHCR